MYARGSKRTVARERYIKVFDRTVLEAVEKAQARIETSESRSPTVAVEIR